MKLQIGPDDRGQRLDVFLASRLNQVTRSHVQSLNKIGAIQINGLQEKDRYRLRGTETIEVNLDSSRPSAAAELEPQFMPLRIHYEDEDLAVIEKPAGVVVHPGAATGNDTIVHGLLFHFKNLSNAGGAARPGIVHRLDKWTSGLLIVAKNDRKMKIPSSNKTETEFLPLPTASAARKPEMSPRRWRWKFWAKHLRIYKTEATPKKL